MTPKFFIYCGETLFPSKNWKRDMARALEVDRITVIRWAKGDYPIPAEREGQIYELVEKRWFAVQALKAKIKTADKVKK